MGIGKKWFGLLVLIMSMVLLMVACSNDTDVIQVSILILIWTRSVLNMQNVSY